MGEIIHDWRDNDTDEEFLTYCYYHSKTERCLFAALHCRRLFRLAKENFPVCRLPDTAFRSMDFELVGPLVEKARKILNRPQASESADCKSQADPKI